MKKVCDMFKNELYYKNFNEQMGLTLLNHLKNKYKIVI